MNLEMYFFVFLDTYTFIVFFKYNCGTPIALHAVLHVHIELTCLLMT